MYPEAWVEKDEKLEG